MLRAFIVFACTLLPLSTVAIASDALYIWKGTLANGDSISFQFAVDGDSRIDILSGHTSKYLDCIDSCRVVTAEEIFVTTEPGFMLIRNDIEYPEFHGVQDGYEDFLMIQIPGVVTCSLWSVQLTPPDCLHSHYPPTFIDFECLNFHDPYNCRHAIWWEHKGHPFGSSIEMSSFSIVGDRFTTRRGTHVDWY